MVRPEVVLAVQDLTGSHLEHPTQAVAGVVAMLRIQRQAALVVAVLAVLLAARGVTVRLTLVVAVAALEVLAAAREVLGVPVLLSCATLARNEVQAVQ
jgi:hypothetical protein